MHHQKIIEQLGYSAKEAQVYLASLALGEAHISDIAVKVKMPRSTVQVIVDRLHSTGLMNFYIMRRYKYWVAERPQKLLEKLQRCEAEIVEALPELTALRQVTRQKISKTAHFNKESIALFKTFSETSHLPILITTSDTEIVYVNTAWQKEFGYTLAEVQGENPRIVQCEETPPSEYTQLWKTLKEDKLFRSDKIIDQARDGTLLKMMTAIFSVYHGNRKFYIQILSDISRQEAAQSMYKNFMQTQKDT